jgi:hypothetical protein
MGQMQDNALNRVALGVAWGYTIASTLLLGMPYLIYVLRSVRINVWHVARLIVRSFAAAIAMGIVVGSLQVGLSFASVAGLPRLALSLAVGFVSYALFAWSELRWLRSQFQTIPR